MFHLMHRARAILLLGVFLLAGSSLPSLDALVYHSGAGELPRSQAHVETAGGCLNHAEHCTLGRTAPGSGAVGTASHPAQVASVYTPSPQPLVTNSGAHRLTLAQPRAPPTLRSV
jgi:hypothetical protein